MGGGDLNLKKSWHPSTLRNIERVWKAEQKHEAEQQKIEQLQKELAAERAREEMHAYAEDQGVVKKRDERLDWMYQGPAALVNREDYLMGRKIDKTFELLQMQESGQNVDKEENHQVGSVFRPDASTSNVTVDLATKIREDPLFAIMKREKEQRKNLLNNPVRMKQLKQMLEQSLIKKKAKKSKKNSRKKHKRARSESSSPSSTESSDNEQSTKYKKRRSDKYEEKHSRDKGRDKAKGDDHKNSSSKKYEYQEHRTDEDRKSRYRDSRSIQYEDAKSSTSSKVRNESNAKDYYYPKEHRKAYSDSRPNSRNNQKHEHKRKLTSEEIEKKYQEMMDNAKWREEQRHKNVERYIKEAEHEDNVDKGNASAFIRPMLSKVAEHGSVEGRVKQKIFTIQRKRGDMDSNFARR